MRRSMGFIKLASMLGIVIAFAPLSLNGQVDSMADLEPFMRHQEPEFLSFDELKSISEYPALPNSPLWYKLERFWATPMINNQAFYAGVKPHHPTSSELGSYLRVVSWNIEKSIEMERATKLFVGSDDDFLAMIDTEKTQANSAGVEEITRQKKRLANADVIILQEMEIGMKRSGYKNATAELAKALNMNYAFAPQYLEVDPVNLGIEKLKLEEGELDEEAMKYYRVDPTQYKGVFGSAVLSRYQIKHVEVRPLEVQPYDWYWGEKQKPGFLENARRAGSKTVFKNEVTRETKVGGRHYFRVDLEVPDLPEKTLTIINIHLEIKCPPRGRYAQMAEILTYIKDIGNPVIMMGDFNSAPVDLSPTSLKKIAVKAAKNPSAWLGLGLQAVVPQASAINVTRGASNVTKNFNDPFAVDVKVVAPNPQKRMFKEIRNFQFSDGNKFDFRGNKDRSINRKKNLLANSNQRGKKGFRNTFSVKRHLGVVGKYRLDWVFVKPTLTEDEKTIGAYRFAPHFGETLQTMHRSLKTPVSDHHPNVVDLPLGEPYSASMPQHLLDL